MVVVILITASLNSNCSLQSSASGKHSNNNFLFMFKQLTADSHAGEAHFPFHFQIPLLLYPCI